MDSHTVKDDLHSLDPALPSLKDWTTRIINPKKSFTLLDDHEGLTVHSVGKGSVVIGGYSDKTTAATQNSTGPQGASDQNGVDSAKQKQYTQKDQRESSGVAACLFDDTVLGSTKATSHNIIDRNYSDLDYDDEGPNALFFGEDRPLSAKERGDRLRQVREKQQMERQQKLEELKEQAAAAQKFREQQETFRRQRIEEMRQRDAERRHQVEERRRHLEMADKERREAALKRNEGREHRLEFKRRQEKSNAVFAFGSSTPRMADKDMSYGYWGNRRATSSTNVNVAENAAPRRPSDIPNSSESDFSRKRATSAHSLNRKGVEDPMSKSFSATTPTAARRRTDIFPVTPSPRDSKHRSPDASGATTPNANSRPSSAQSHRSGQLVLRQKTTRKPRPLSIAGSSLSSADRPSSAALRKSRPIERKSSVGSNKMDRTKSPIGSDSIPTSAKTSRATTPKRTPAQVKAESAARKAKSKAASLSLPKVSPEPKESSVTAPTEKEDIPKTVDTPKSEPPQSNIEVLGQSDSVSQQVIMKSDEILVVETTSVSSKNSSDNSISIVNESLETVKKDTQITETVHTQIDITENKENQEVNSQSTENIIQTEIKSDISTEIKNEIKLEDKSEIENGLASSTSNTVEITSKSELEGKSQTSTEDIAKEKPVTGYATEEEYKAVLAEKRRLAREAKERELELERQRELEEQERERKEEEEYLRMIEEQKKAEEERLKKAIEEAERQRELEAKRKEEEEQQRIEAEKIEKQKALETAERLKKEEEERLERKRRVDAIMARTRGKGTPSKDDLKQEDIKSDVMSESFMANVSSMTDSMIEKAIEEKTQSIEVTVDTKVNGDSEITTPNGETHDVVSNGQLASQNEKQFDSFDPFSPTSQPVTIESSPSHPVLNESTSSQPVKSESTLDQLIDINQPLISNEDAVNSNPPVPSIVFEENINMKQNQESSNVPDLLL